MDLAEKTYQALVTQMETELGNSLFDAMAHFIEEYLSNPDPDFTKLKPEIDAAYHRYEVGLSAATAIREMLRHKKDDYG